MAAWLAKQVELAVAQVELSLPQYRILGLLADGSALPSALAQQLAVRPPTVTAVVDGLVARGLVERSHGGGDDRRRVTHRLTEAGEALLRAADEAADERLAVIAGRLEDPADAERALGDLELWRRAVVAHHLARQREGRAT